MNVTNKSSYVAVKLFDNLTKERAIVLEKMYILKYGKKSLGGTLVNLTDGGDGTEGHFPSDETKKIWSRQRSGSGNSQYGKPRSERTKKLISAKNKGRQVSSVNIEKLRQRMLTENPNKGVKYSEERCQQMSDSRKGKPGHANPVKNNQSNQSPGRTGEKSIRLTTNGFFQIYIKRNGVGRCYGSYPTLSEAVLKRDIVLHCKELTRA